MIIRSLQPSDIDRIKEIHARYYSDEFEFPNFIDRYLCAFVVVENDDIIAAGGVRNIAESVLITNKDKSVRNRRTALYQVLDASAFIAGKHGHTQLHAFIQDDIWKHQLETVGFVPMVGDGLVLNL